MRGLAVILLLSLSSCGRVGFDLSEGDRASDASRGPDGAALDGDVQAANLVFVTSAAYSVDALGGLAGADALCNQHADAGGLPGTFRAWLSTRDLAARDRFEGSAGWTRLDGKLFVRTMDDVAASRVYYPVAFDERGVNIPSTAVDAYYWTGTRYNGTAGSVTCDSFTSSAGIESTDLGLPTAGTYEFSEAARSSCDSQRRLLCLGVDRLVTLDAPPRAGQRLAFATAASFNGDLGGLAGADTICQAAADSAGHVGTYRALLGTSTAAAGARFSATGPTWVRPDGVELAPTAEDVLAFDWQAPLNVDELGEYRWFSAKTGGLTQVVAETCQDWTSAAETDVSTFRSLVVADDRTRNDTCNKVARLWCLEE